MEASMSPQGMLGGGPGYPGRKSSLRKLHEQRLPCEQKSPEYSRNKAKTPQWPQDTEGGVHWEMGLERVSVRCEAGWGMFVEGYGARGPGCMQDLVIQENASIHETLIFQKFRFFETWPCPLGLSRHLFRGKNPPTEHRRCKGCHAPSWSDIALLTDRSIPWSYTGSPGTTGL